MTSKTHLSQIGTNHYFSGFCLQDEQELFSEYLIQNDFTVSGFSYGAIKAIELVVKSLELGVRVDLLQLFSPSFFNDKDKKFKKMQLIYFKKDSEKYCNNFINNCSFPTANFKLLTYFHKGTFDELKELLYYEWDEKKFQFLNDKGVEIEVYLGGKDKIIDSKKAKEFFVQFGTVYYIKNAGHILK